MAWWIWVLGGLVLLLGEVVTPGGFFVIFFGAGAILRSVIDANAVPYDRRWRFASASIGASITHAHRRAAVVNAIAAEDLFFKGDKPENNVFEPDEEAIDALVRDFLHSGIPVLSVDYVSEKKKVAKYCAAAAGRGFLPYAAPARELNIMGPPYEGEGTMIA